MKSTSIIAGLVLFLSILMCNAPCFAQCYPGQTWYGEGTYCELGGKVVGGSDLNNDSVPDFFIVSFYWNSGHLYQTPSGRVYIYSGADYSPIDTLSGETVGLNSWGVGRDLDTLGDVNGDGYGDFLLSAYTWVDSGDTTTGGAAFVMSGADRSVIHAVQDTLSSGMWTMVRCIGDITKDGVNDFMVGGWASYGYSARVTVYNGATAEVLTTFTDPDGNSNGAGASGAGVGDLNGDTYPDFVIGTQRWGVEFPTEKRGRIDVYSGQTFELLWSVEGDTAGTELGIDVSGVGDVNGDGVNDVLCGTHFNEIPGSDNAFGYALILSGTDGSVIRKHMAFNKCRDFGFRVAGLGDLNHDGYADYGIADESYNVGNGGSWAFSGYDGSELDALNGGSSISTVGDVNGDGTPDILVGNLKAQYNGLKSGWARLAVCVWPSAECADGTDTDGDGWDDECDDCPYWWDQYQIDSDGDGIGDLCTQRDTMNAGANVTVGNNYGSFRFENVTSDGALVCGETSTGPPTSGVFTAVPQTAPRFYEVTTTATFTGKIDIMLGYYPDGLSAAQEDSIRMFHYTGSAWEDITDSIDTPGDLIYGSTTSLSPFGIGIPVLVGVDDPIVAIVPGHFRLGQSYPNPSNPTATIEFTLPEAAHVNLTIFDVLGRSVVTLIDDAMPAGSNRVMWHGRNAAGKRVPSGTYFYRMQSAQYSETRKLILLK